MEVVGLDIETAMRDEYFNRKNLSAYKFDCELRSIQLSDGCIHRVIDLWHTPKEEIQELKDWMNNADVLFVGANLGNFDIPILRRFGFKPKNFADLSQLSRLAHNEDIEEVNERLHSLSRMLEREFGLEKYTVMGANNKEKEEEDEYLAFSDPAPFSREVYEYCLRDVEYLVPLYYAFACRIPKKTLELEIEVMQILADMTYRGMRVDVAAMEHRLETAAESLDTMQQEVEEILSIKNFNIGSPESKAEFFSKLGIPKPKVFDKKQGKERISFESRAVAEVYVDLEDEDKLAALRSFATIVAEKKLRDTRTYLVTHNHGKDEHRIHPGYNSFGTRTGRMSSSSPNAQNMPRAFREFIIPKEGHSLVVADLGQIEPRILALLIQDKNLVDACNANDFYIYVAANSGLGYEEVSRDRFSKEYPGVRDQFKVYFLATSYGGGPRNMVTTVATDLLDHEGDSEDLPNLMTMDQASVITEAVEANFPIRTKHVERIRRAAKGINPKRGFLATVPGWYNRRVYARRGKINTNEILNTPVQGLAAVHMKLGLLWLKEYNLDKYLINVVHDEVVLEVPNEEASSISEKVKNCFQNALFDLSESVSLAILGSHPEEFITMDVVISDRWEKP